MKGVWQELSVLSSSASQLKMVQGKLMDSKESLDNVTADNQGMLAKMEVNAAMLLVFPQESRF